MRRSYLLAICFLAVVTPTIASAPIKVHEDSDYIYCSIDDISGSKAVYFSDVFLGDFSSESKYGSAFAAYVAGKYDGTYSTASCLYDTDIHQEKEKEDSDRATRRSLGKRIVNTGWTY
jgi:hypothetical protein